MFQKKAAESSAAFFLREDPNALFGSAFRRDYSFKVDNLSPG